MMDAPSLETVKVWMNRAEQPDLIQEFKMSVAIAAGLDYMTLKGPLQPKLFYDSTLL